jgi:hypothetical protein
MNIIELTTIAPFVQENYIKVFPTVTKKLLFMVVSLFIVWQFILTVIPTAIALPHQLSLVRTTAKAQLFSIVEPLQFSYIGIKDSKLVTDLAAQPFTIIVNSSETVETILVIDSTGQATEEIFKNRDGKEITGIALLQDKAINKLVNSNMSILPYADYLSTTSFTWSKTEILTVLRTDADSQFIKSVLLTPKSIAIIALLVILGILLYFIGAFVGFTLWSGLFTLILFSLMKASPARRPQSLFKLAAFAYIGYWYSSHIFTIIVQNFQFIRPLYSYVVALILPGVFLWFMYRAKNPKVIAVKEKTVSGQ